MDEHVWQGSPFLSPAIRRFGLPAPKPTSVFTGLLVTSNWGIGIGDLFPVEVGDQAFEEMLTYIARVNERRGR